MKQVIVCKFIHNICIHLYIRCIRICIPLYIMYYDWLECECLSQILRYSSPETQDKERVSHCHALGQFACVSHWVSVEGKETMQGRIWMHVYIFICICGACVYVWVWMCMGVKDETANRLYTHLPNRRLTYIYVIYIYNIIYIILYNI